jgi:putative transposase
MSTATKVELVRSVQDQFGLTPALAAIGLPRATWYYRVGHPHPYEERHARLRAPLERIAVEHPEYGYRRTTTELRERLGETINPKVVRRCINAGVCRWCGAPRRRGRAGCAR